MIEIVKEPTPVEKVVEEPRNVRQIGTLPKDARVYVEDYVYRFLHGSSRQKKRYAFILLGEIRQGGQQPNLYIKGAMELRLPRPLPERFHQLPFPIRQSEMFHFTVLPSKC